MVGEVNYWKNSPLNAFSLWSAAWFHLTCNAYCSWSRNCSFLFTCFLKNAISSDYLKTIPSSGPKKNKMLVLYQVIRQECLSANTANLKYCQD